MTTLSAILAQLQKEGYTEDFNPSNQYLADQRSAILLSPHEFVVDRHYRFEGNSDPDDEAVVCTISSPKFNLKGNPVNAYGIYSDAASDELMKALQVKIAS